MNDYTEPILAEIQSAVSIPVDLELEDGYPDVMFNIVFTKHPDDSMSDAIASSLEHFMLKYNRLHFLRPIHYVADKAIFSDDTSSFSFYFHMDCGNANPKSALIGAVKAIANTNLPIYRIIIEC